jgi:hypothetical protein
MANIIPVEENKIVGFHYTITNKQLAARAKNDDGRSSFLFGRNRKIYIYVSSTTRA